MSCLHAILRTFKNYIVFSPNKSAPLKSDFFRNSFRNNDLDFIVKENRIKIFIILCQTVLNFFRIFANIILDCGLLSCLLFIILIRRFKALVYGLATVTMVVKLKRQIKIKIERDIKPQLTNHLMFLLQKNCILDAWG